MNHAAAQNLDPALALTEPAALAAALEAAYVHLCAGLCEREMVRPELGLGIRSEKLLGELLQRAL